MHLAYFRFYEELNDFLPPGQHKQTLPYRFAGHPAIKDPIEVFGVPHTEVELIIVNGEPVGFDYHLQPQDRIAVYPVFESFDITSLVRLREKPLRRTAFVVDANLGKLARHLRLLGFDALYSNAFNDSEIAQISADAHRIVLTRDRRLLHRKLITHGYWVRSVHVEEQISEVMQRFNLEALIEPFNRCVACNGEIRPVAKRKILHRLEPLTIKYYDEFYQCQQCGKIYWEGSHFNGIQEKLGPMIKNHSDKLNSK